MHAGVRWHACQRPSQCMHVYMQRACATPREIVLLTVACSLHAVRTCSIGSSSISPPSLLSSKTRIPSVEQHSCTSTGLRLSALILGKAVEMTSAPNRFHMAALSLAAATGTEPRYLHLTNALRNEWTVVGQWWLHELLVCERYPSILPNCFFFVHLNCELEKAQTHTYEHASPHVRFLCSRACAW
jgi:hypothetical protein